MMWRYAALLWKKLKTGVKLGALLRSKWLYGFLVVVATFPDTLRNMYLAARFLDPNKLVGAGLAASETVGLSLQRLVDGLSLLSGQAGIGSVSTLPELPGFLLAGLKMYPGVAGVYLVAVSVTTPIIFFGTLGYFVQFVESTDPTLAHYSFFVLTFVLLVAVYGEIVSGDGLGFAVDLLTGLTDEVDALFGASGGENATAVGAPNSSAVNATAS